GVPVTSSSHSSSSPELNGTLAVAGPSAVYVNSTTVTATGASPVIPGPLESLAAPPPPSYEMVLELKRKEDQLNREIEEEEEQERTTTADRIRNLLRGRSWHRRTEQECNEEGIARSSSRSSSGYITSPLEPSAGGVFTISREDIVPAGQRYHPDDVPAPGSPSTLSSHSDYSSSFISSPSNSSRLFSPVAPNTDCQELVRQPIL
ncbi:unnamed protein product, partial [Meganyctiphanes norvegica]